VWVEEATDVIKAVKQEFYDRIVVPYEIEKIKQNGDVY
jgi:hypothetical protein